MAFCVAGQVWFPNWLINCLISNAINMAFNKMLFDLKPLTSLELLKQYGALKPSNMITSPESQQTLVHIKIKIVS